MSLEDLQEGVDRKATLIHSLLFVAGFSIIFITLGASASFLGAFLRYYEVWIARIGGAVIIVLGLHLTGVFRIAPLMRERRIHVKDKPAGYIGTIGVGAAFRGWMDALHRPHPGSDPDVGRNPGHGLGRGKPAECLLVGTGHPVPDFPRWLWTCSWAPSLASAGFLPIDREGSRSDTHHPGPPPLDGFLHDLEHVPHQVYAGLGLGENLGSASKRLGF